MKHFYRSIPGWSAFVGFYADAVKEAPQAGARFVEVGAWKGRSAAYMGVEIINSGKSIWFDAIDHWRGSSEHQADPDVAAGRLYEVFLRNVSPVLRAVHPVRLGSIEAADCYADASLDFVLIDAGHEYKHALPDLRAWLPKVKSGGVLAGDDYTRAGVRRACDEVFGGYVGDGPPGRTKPHSCWRVRV